MRYLHVTIETQFENDQKLVHKKLTVSPNLFVEMQYWVLLLPDGSIKCLYRTREGSVVRCGISQGQEG